MKIVSYTSLFALLLVSTNASAELITNTSAGAISRSFDSFPPFDFEMNSGATSASASASTGGGAVSTSATAGESGGSLRATVSAASGIGEASGAGILSYRLSGVDEFFVNGIWSASGNGRVSVTGARVGGEGSGDFLLRLGDGPGALSELTLSTEVVSLDGLRGDARIVYSIYPVEGPNPGLPGATPTNPIRPTTSTIARTDPPRDLSDFESSTPTPTAGTYFTPIVDDSGRTASLFYGPAAGASVSLALAKSESPLQTVALATTSAQAFGFFVDDNAITHFELPFEFPGGQTDFSVHLPGMVVPYTAGSTLDLTSVFPDGVQAFALSGFESSLSLTEGAGLPFVVGLRYASNGSASLTVFEGTAIPEPSGVVCLGAAIYWIGAFRRRACYR